MVKMLTEAGSTRAWRQLREYVLTRDDGLCQVPRDDGTLCLAYATHADHIVPRSRGGADTAENLRAACRACNLRRGADQLQLARAWEWT